MVRIFNLTLVMAGLSLVGCTAATPPGASPDGGDGKADDWGDQPLSPCSEVDGRCMHVDGDCDVEIGAAWSSVDIECNDSEMQCCVVYGEEDPEPEPLSPCSEVDGRCIHFDGDCDVEIGVAWSSVDIECNDWEMQCCVIYGE